MRTTYYLWSKDRAVRSGSRNDTNGCRWNRMRCRERSTRPLSMTRKRRHSSAKTRRRRTRTIYSLSVADTDIVLRDKGRAFALQSHSSRYNVYVLYHIVLYTCTLYIICTYTRVLAAQRRRRLCTCRPRTNDDNIIIKDYK